MPDANGGALARLWRGFFGKAVPQGKITPLPVPMVATAAQGSSQDDTGPGRIKGASTGFFPPWQPLQPFAPAGTGGRQFDYPTGINLNYIPRGDGRVPFGMLRALADNLPILRTVIEKRKDQIEGWEWDVQPVRIARDKRKSVDQPDPRVTVVKSFLTRPDRRLPFNTWLRSLLEDMLVVDAATIYPRMTRGGKLYSLDIVDGTTIKVLINPDGRPPLPDEGPAYQQILHGVPAADFAFDELIYMPRNLRSHGLYGLPPVEQILLTINIALRRDMFNLNYYDASTLPEAFVGLPKEWSGDQISSFQTYFDSLLSGNGAERRKVRFMPGEFDYKSVREPPLKDQYDEWLARIVCAAFSVPPNPYVADNARATAQTIQVTANQEGIGPLKRWIKGYMDFIIQGPIGFPDLEFTWSGTDNIDPLEQAQKLQIYVASGVMTRDEARDELGLDALGMKLTGKPTIDHAVFATDGPAAVPPPPMPAGGPPAGPGGKPRARPKKPADAARAASPKTPAAAAHKDPTKTVRRTNRKAAGNEKTLYVHRKLANPEPLIEWAKANGFETTLEPDDMHVTVAFSKAPVDWEEMPVPVVAGIMVAEGERRLERFGDAVVLVFDDDELAYRWNELCEAGASWDHPEYHSHVTLSYEAADIDLDSIEPFDGELDFGPEVWSEVKDDWKDSIAEI